jgi:glycosyltransferase involved in cell wall biosynthesis
MSSAPQCFSEVCVKLSVLMPAFNEAKTIRQVVARVQAVPLEMEIVLVNDASSDGTAGIVDDLASSDVRVLHHAVNRGKGAAIRTALDAATGDLVVIQDADLEYDPNDLVRLIAPLADGTAEVVYGVRPLHSQRLIMRLGNRFVTLLANLLYGQRLEDMETCYKMMRRELAQSLDLECRRFDVEAEITAKVLRSGCTIHELPISYTARYENKKLSPLDGWPTAQALWRYRKWKPRMQRSA